MVRSWAIESWKANALDDSVELNRLQRLLASREHRGEESAPRWFLFGEALLRYGRLRGLLSATETIGAGHVSTPKRASATLGKVEKDLHRLGADRTLLFELRGRVSQLLGDPESSSRSSTPVDSLMYMLRLAEGTATLNYASRKLEVPLRLESRGVAWAHLLEGMDRADRREVVWRVQNRKLSMLLFSGIVDDNYIAEPSTAVLRGAEMREPGLSPSVRAYCESVLPEEAMSLDGRVPLLRLLERLDELAREGGYEGLLEILHGAGLGQGSLGRDWRNSQFNVVPSVKRGECRPIVLATVRGRTGPLAFGSVLRKLGSVLYGCKGVAQAVIVLTDQWDSQDFAENHQSLWAEAASAGVRFLVFVLGPGLAGLNPVRLDLS